jgi:ferric-dicitrate binding protein FerR (iron transport regulator)
MSDDYLWDGDGSDPEIEKLEATLREVRFDQPVPSPEAAATGGPSKVLRWNWLLAAGLLLAAGGAVLLAPEPEPIDGWSVLQIEGRSVCPQDSCVLGVGDWIETDGTSQVILDVADIGHMEVGPDTRLRLVATGPDQHRLELAQGRIEAMVVAPPRLLIVDTPGAAAVDLGCAYTLDIDPSGHGTLHVDSGHVSLERGESVVTVPAGAWAPITPDGPGLPVWQDAPEALVRAADTLDAHAMVRAARDVDTLTLVHALPLVERPERAVVVERLDEIEEIEVEPDQLVDLAPDALELTTESCAWSPQL